MNAILTVSMSVKWQRPRQSETTEGGQLLSRRDWDDNTSAVCKQGKKHKTHVTIMQAGRRQKRIDMNLQSGVARTWHMEET